MNLRGFRLLMLLPCCLAAFAQTAPPDVPRTHRVVLVELFTSEGCSDCPPADALLRQMTGKITPAGQLIIGISEHVTYWNHLGWMDPFSDDRFTQRQSDYSSRFGLESAYTPQMVVNGREQLVGGNHAALAAAFAAEADHQQISLHIDSAQANERDVTFTYSASDLPPKVALRLMAVLVDDSDQSSVLRGENSGKQLTHAWVARTITPLGKLSLADHQSTTLPLPPAFASAPGRPHHLVLFAQQGTSGVVLGADAKSLIASPAVQARASTR